MLWNNCYYSDIRSTSGSKASLYTHFSMHYIYFMSKKAEILIQTQQNYKNVIETSGPVIYTHQQKSKGF